MPPEDKKLAQAIERLEERLAGEAARNEEILRRLRERDAPPRINPRQTLRDAYGKPEQEGGDDDE